VFYKQLDSCCRSSELNAAPSAEFALALRHAASQLEKTASKRSLAYQNLSMDLLSYCRAISAWLALWLLLVLPQLIA